MFKQGLVFTAALFGLVACSGANAGNAADADAGVGPAQAPTADPPVAAADDADAAGVDAIDAGDTPNAPNAPSGPYPIVLVHGMGGFEHLHLGAVEMPYWNGIVADLQKRGERVYVTTTPPYDSSEVRAVELQKQIDEILALTGKAKVNIIAHSQGGLDARVLVSPAGLGYADKVATISMISTPNHGSRVADGVLGLLKGVSSKTIDDITGALLGLLEKTVYDRDEDPHLRAQLLALSESYMEGTFNPKYVDAPNVTYWSYAGRSNLRSGKGVCDDGIVPNDPSEVDPAAIELAPLAAFLENGDSKKNVNDGLVTVTSAKWGRFVQCVPADHLKEVGVLSTGLEGFDQKAFVRGIVERVRASGN